MKKLWFVFALLLLIAGSTMAQEANYAKPHKIVVQLQSGDTLAHKSLFKQLNNMITVSPKSQIEVVCHGPGITILMPEKSKFTHELKPLVDKGVVFVACEFTMSEKKITKAQLAPEAGLVKYGILEVVTKEEKGWSYIKGGF